MLVLTRTEGQKIIIGPLEKPIGEIIVTDIRGGRVQLGFKGFAREIEIHRDDEDRLYRR